MLNDKFFNYFPYIIAEKLIFKKIRKIFGNNIEFFVGGGDLLDIKQQEFFASIGAPVFQGYGLTEAAPIISANTPYEFRKHIKNLMCGKF